MSPATDRVSFALTTSAGDYLPRPDTERALALLEHWVLNTATRSIWITGPPGMGKTLLVNRMARMARKHSDLKCGTVRYEVIKTGAGGRRIF